MYSRPTVGEDYKADYSFGGIDVCLSSENFAGTDLFALKFLLKQHPGKNIELAKQFFRQRSHSSNKRFDYDEQEITLIYFFLVFQRYFMFF